MPDTHDALEKGARLGYAARGVVYLIIGGLAFLAAVGSGGGTTGSRGALQTLLGQPFGKLLLGLIALGLIAYAVWRFVMAWNDPENKGDDAKGGAQRAGYLVSGLANLSLGLFAGSLATPGISPFGGGSGGGSSGDGSGSGDSASDWTAWLMSFPLGQWLVALIGLGFIAVACVYIVRAYTASFEKKLSGPAHDPKIRNICRFGIASRAVVFAIIGAFLVLAAWQSDPSEARGLGAALQTLAQQPYGWVLLAIVGAGLVAFAFYSFITARYRHIQTA